VRAEDHRGTKAGIVLDRNFDSFRETVEIAFIAFKYDIAALYICLGLAKAQALV
jgi:hypothetical protein